MKTFRQMMVQGKWTCQLLPTHTDGLLSLTVIWPVVF